VYLRKDQPQLSLPFNYRDPRTESTFESGVRHASRKLIFENTGIQFMPFNSLYQLLSDQERSPYLLEVAEHFLLIGDYLNYLFSGIVAAEESLASTTQLYDPKRRAWSHALIHLFGFPERLFPPIVPSGTALGPLLPEVCEEVGLSPAVKVVATCSHDTGAAVAGIPAKGTDWAYLSSGTWSLIGVELPSPLISSEARELNFTNEAGFGGTTRFLKNIIGLWILQESRRTWMREGEEYSFSELDRHAEEAEPLRSLINPNDERFLRPDAMPDKIREFCRESGQPEPESAGEFVRCIYESLSLLYRRTLEDLHHLTGRNIQRLHIVGGGSQSRLFNQFVANATEINVHAGPVEATATGNVLIQAIALGHLDSLEAAREVSSSSSRIETFHPLAAVKWQAAYERFKSLLPVG
jgi:rhamnulokinase